MKTQAYECTDCGMQSDDWDEYVAHCRDIHLALAPGFPTS
jgi:hypothetical protein